MPRNRSLPLDALGVGLALGFGLAVAAGAVASLPSPPEVPAAEPGDTRLAELGFGALVVHRAALSEPEWARADVALRQALGPPSEAGPWGARWRLDLSAP